jgi:ISXO2-like transposase domain
MLFARTAAASPSMLAAGRMVRPRWRCKACRKDFSVTSGTLFAFHKMPLRSYLMAVAIFANEVKGKSMLALSRDLGTQYKTAFVLAHKIREAMASEVRRTAIGGQGKRAEVDGGYFGGYVKPANFRENRRDRRLRQNQSGKRKVVVVIRERGPEGKTLPGVFATEADALAFIARQVPRGTELYADEASSWNALHARYELHRINHQEAYSLPGRGLHQQRRIILLADAARRNRPPSPYRRAVSHPLRARGRMARGSSERGERIAC